MIHYDWRHVMAQQELRHRESARQRRPENIHLPAAQRAPGYYHRFLAYLGRKLVDLGCQLQTPYKRTAALPPIGARPSDPQLRPNC